MAADREYVDEIVWAIRRAGVAAGVGLVVLVSLLWLGSLAGWQ
jgi:hypothetical protein